MIIHNFDPVFLDFGFFQIRWYSLAYIIGIALGWFYAIKIINLKKYSNKIIDLAQFDSFLIYLILGIILGGRLGYVFFYDLEYYFLNIPEIFKVWRGGMSFHGGLLGVTFATLIFCKIKKLNFFGFADIICCAAPIGLFLGRISNFINGELFGKPSNLPWSVIFPQGGNIARHPSQIYEAILEGLVLFAIINFLAIKKNLLLKSGFISGFFLIFYSIFRIFSEIFREPDGHIGYLFGYFSMGTILSFITIFAGLLIIYVKSNEQNN